MDMEPLLSPTSSLSSSYSCSDYSSDEELDYYFASVGPISRLPTPPLKGVAHPVVIVHPCDDESFCMDSWLLETMSRKLSSLSSRLAGGRTASVPKVMQYVKTAQLPASTIALAYNILNELKAPSSHKRHDSAGPELLEETTNFQRNDDAPRLTLQPELFVLAALQVASSFMIDQPIRMSTWVVEIANNAFTRDELSAMNAHVLSSVEWRLQYLATPFAIDNAMQKLQCSGYSMAPSRQQLRKDRHMRVPELLLDGKTIIEHGLLSPSRTPISGGYFD